MNGKESMIVRTDYATYSCDWIELEAYCADCSPAILLWSAAEGPIAHITVCLDDDTLEWDEAYVDTNNCPWAPEFIEKYHLGKPSGRTRKSGYCEYPAYIFDIGEVMKYVREEE